MKTPYNKKLEEVIINNNEINNEVRKHEDKLYLFPTEVLERICYEQILQGNRPDLSVFVHNLFSSKEDGGFDFQETDYEKDFWYETLSKNWELFYEKYPTRFSLDNVKNGKVCILNDNPNPYDCEDLNKVLFYCVSNKVNITKSSNFFTINNNNIYGTDTKPKNIPCVPLSVMVKQLEYKIKDIKMSSVKNEDLEYFPQNENKGRKIVFNEKSDTIHVSNLTNKSHVGFLFSEDNYKCWIEYSSEGGFKSHIVRDGVYSCNGLIRKNVEKKLQHLVNELKKDRIYHSFIEFPTRKDLFKWLAE